MVTILSEFHDLVVIDLESLYHNNHNKIIIILVASLNNMSRYIAIHNLLVVFRGTMYHMSIGSPVIQRFFVYGEHSSCVL